MLAVRVPSNYGRTPPTPETARQLGCDVPAWVKHGWVDFVAVSEFLFERGDLPIGLWKQAITTVPVYGGIECTKGGAEKNLTADEYRQAATQLLEQGADGVYLFNFFTSREEGAKAYEPPFEVLRDLGAPREIAPPHQWPRPQFTRRGGRLRPSLRVAILAPPFTGLCMSYRLPRTTHPCRGCDFLGIGLSEYFLGAKLIG